MLPKLPKRLKNKWIKALRSEDYVQAQSYLYAGNNPEGKPQCCCLGVLENICGTPLEDMNEIGICSDLHGKSNVPEIFVNPEKKIRYISTDPYNGNKNSYMTNLEGLFANLNDGKKWSFKKIASYIERYL